MQRKQLRFGNGFHVALGSRRSQAATRTIAVAMRPRAPGPARGNSCNPSVESRPRTRLGTMVLVGRFGSRHPVSTPPPKSPRTIPSLSPHARGSTTTFNPLNTPPGR